VAERERDLLLADTDLVRRRIRETMSASWSSLQASDTVLNAARAGVVAGERALRDAQLRYRALVEPLTEVLACATGTAGGPGIPSDSPGPAIDRTGGAGAGDRNHGPGFCAACGSGSRPALTWLVKTPTCYEPPPVQAHRLLKAVLRKRIETHKMVDRYDGG
jgi:hypothetical protein